MKSHKSLHPASWKDLAASFPTKSPWQTFKRIGKPWKIQRDRQPPKNATAILLGAGVGEPTAMASIIVTAGSGRTTIAVHRSSSEWISFLPQILALAGGVLIAVLAAFLVFHFRARLWNSPGPWVALVTCVGALFGVCMQSIQSASYLGSRSVLTFEGLYLTVHRTRSFLFHDLATCPCPALFGLRWAFPEVGRPFGDGSSGARMVGPQSRLLWLSREPLGEVLADVDGEPVVLASALTQGDGFRLISEMCAAYSFGAVPTAKRGDG
jgi:hypothetical protein